MERIKNLLESGEYKNLTVDQVEQIALEEFPKFNDEKLKRRYLFESYKANNKFNGNESQIKKYVDTMLYVDMFDGGSF